jgi:S-adenosylmethionine:tRNA ribosyltransferase-isomerase
LPRDAVDGEIVTFADDGAPDAGPLFAGAARHEGGHWALAGQTRLFLRVPDRVTGADGLLTNFHLPGSSLIMLVATLLGEDRWRGVYDEAIARRLRFYSYGDAMIILPDRKADR